MTTGTTLIVSPYFPPATLAGVHRARHLAKHLPQFGWTPIVVAVDEAFHEERLDFDLARLVPSELEIIKVRAMSAQVSRTLGFGDISLRAWVPLHRSIVELLKTRKIDAVLITGSPFYPMLMASEIRRRFKVPVVLDFQDPWVSDWGATLPQWTKGGLSHWLSTFLEPRAVRAADFVTSVSEIQNTKMAGRYPWMNSEHMAAIPIGGDPDDYSALKRLKSGYPHRGDSKANKTLSYVGTFMPRTAPVMEQFFKGFALARKRRPDLLETVKLRFVGTSNQPNDTTSYRVTPIAKAQGVADAVIETPQRIPYLEAISVLAQSDGVILVGSDERHYTASKIYPALMSGRPFISLFHEESSSHDILTRAGGGVALGFANGAALGLSPPRIADAFIRIVEAPQSLGRVDPTTYEQYSAQSVSLQFAKIFDKISKPLPRGV